MILVLVVSHHDARKEREKFFISMQCGSRASSAWSYTIKVFLKHILHNNKNSMKSENWIFLRSICSKNTLFDIQNPNMSSLNSLPRLTLSTIHNFKKGILDNTSKKEKKTKCFKSLFSILRFVLSFFCWIFFLDFVV